MRKTIVWSHNMAALNSPEGTLAEVFNSRFFESSQLILPSFHYTTTKKSLKKRYTQDCGIWRWNTRGGIHAVEYTLAFGIAWSSWSSRKKIWGNSGTFYKYSGCFVWGYGERWDATWLDGPRFLRGAIACAKWYCLYKLVCLCVFSLVLDRWCDGFTSKIYLWSKQTSGQW